MRKICIAVVLPVIMTASVFAADLSVPVTDDIPRIDGVITTGEYAVSATEGGITLYASRTDDGMLYLAVSADTEGWVALGLGSNRMDGAHLVMGYRDGAESVIEEHSVSGHFHRRSGDTYVVDAATDEGNGTTGLEFSLPKDAFTSAGRIQLILAYGRRDNFVSKHREYRRLDLLL